MRDQRAESSEGPMLARLQELERQLAEMSDIDLDSDDNDDDGYMLTLPSVVTEPITVTDG